jgi:ABC-type antimicrobial peptide transport system permease subunit
MVYEHFWRMQPVAMSYVVRTRPGLAAMVAKRLRTELAALDPEMAIARTWTMEEIVEESVAVRRFQMSLALSFGICALLLASIGVYGVISYAVTRRTPEIGIRAALGASQREILQMVVVQGMRPVLLGVTVGTGVAILMGRLIASQLFQVSPSDPLLLAAVIAMLLGAGFTACYAPAARAARVDPVQALRFE